MAAGVVNHASSLLQRLLLYVCCCSSHEDSSELCQDWVDCPIDGVQTGRRSEREGESEGLFLSVSVFMQTRYK